ncbi:MAG: substrate-binding domain-containing protein [Planctomycetales bacterium]
MMVPVTFSKWNSVLVLACLAIVTCLGCEPPPPPATTVQPQVDPNNPAAAKTGAVKDYRIVMLTNGSSPFWDACDLGMREAGKKLGVKVEFIRNDATEGGQIRRLEQFASQSDIKGVGISVLAKESVGVADQMKKLREKGIHVIAIDSDGAPDSREAFVGTNNIEAGEELGRATAALRPTGGEAVCFVGRADAQNAIERIDGFKKGIGSNIKLVDTMEDQVDETKARNNVTAAIQNHPKLNVLAGIWSYNAPAIADVVDAGNKRDKFKVVVFDAEPNAIAAMDRGLIDVMVVQNPFEMGYQGTVLLNAMIQKDEATVKSILKGKDTVDTGLKVIVPSADSPVKSKYKMTLKEFKTWLADKKLEGS